VAEIRAGGEEGKFNRILKLDIIKTVWFLPIWIYISHTDIVEQCLVIDNTV
jgi:hypothetical protein